MKRRYKNSAGNSGVVSYEIVGSALVVEFVGADCRYVYNTLAPGEAHVKAMMKLAARGKGLATYISQHVQENYASKVPL